MRELAQRCKKSIFIIQVSIGQEFYHQIASRYIFLCHLFPLSALLISEAALVSL